MAAAGTILVKTLNLLAGKVRPGVTTRELDDAAEKFIRSQGAEPAFKGYRGFPGSICASPNSMIVHGIPGNYKLVARRHPVGRRRRRARRVGGRRGAHVPGRPDHAGRAQAAHGHRGVAVPGCARSARSATGSATSRTRSRQHVEAAGLSIVRALVGHGIGRSMHEEPQIPNYGEPGTGIVLEEGMVLAIEPMVTAGRHAIRVADDHWSIYSQDGSLAAHFEFTIAITARRAADPDALARGRKRPFCGLNRSFSGADTGGMRANGPLLI